MTSPSAGTKSEAAGPSEAAVKAGAVGVIDPTHVYAALPMEHWEATIGRMATDPRIVETARRALTAAMDPALGADRLVVAKVERQRTIAEVVEKLRESARLSPDDISAQVRAVANAIERKFGASS